MHNTFEFRFSENITYYIIFYRTYFNIIFFESLRFLVPFKDDLITIQTTVYQIRTPKKSHCIFDNVILNYSWDGKTQLVINFFFLKSLQPPQPVISRFVEGGYVAHTTI